MAADIRLQHLLPLRFRDVVADRVGGGEAIPAAQRPRPGLHQLQGFALLSSRYQDPGRTPGHQAQERQHDNQDRNRNQRTPHSLLPL